MSQSSAIPGRYSGGPNRVGDWTIKRDGLKLLEIAFITP